MNKKWNLVFGLVVLTIVIVVILLRKHSAPPEVTFLDETKRRQGPCPGEVKSVESENKKFQLTSNWYECHPVTRGDLVFYQYSFTRPAVARRVVAEPGDRIAVKKDRHQHWNLWVNEKVALNSEKKPYEFGNEKHDPVLALYTHQNNGKLKAREAVVFSEPIAGSLDSGMFGVVNADDFLGKLEEVSKP